jgi:hypothetical protein
MDIQVFLFRIEANMLLNEVGGYRIGNKTHGLHGSQPSHSCTTLTPHG